MSYIRIYDTTLRDGEQTPGVHFSAHQKLDIAKRLSKLGVDIIEAGFPVSSSGDFDAVRMISEASGRGELGDTVVSALSRMTRSDIDTCASAIAGAKHKRLHVFIATSDIHLRNKLKITREEALARIRETIPYAVSLNVFDEIEFSAEDATRTDCSYLTEVIGAAVGCGAGIINIPDTVGYSTPSEFSALIEKIRKDVPGEYAVSVHCHNDLGMATANSLAAVSAGATQVECCINGLGERAGNAATEEIVMALRVRNDSIRCRGKKCETGIITKEIAETSRLISSISGIAVSPNKAVVGGNAFTHASGIHQHGIINAPETYEIMKPEEIGLNSNTLMLGKLSGKHAFSSKLEDLGYTLDQAGIDATFTRFKEIADKKPVITGEDLRAIVGEYLDSLEGMYYLNSFQIQSGNRIKAMALVSLEIKNGEDKVVTEAAPGEGPVDAAFNAINRISGAEQADIELVSYNITAITEGTDALGEAKVKIKAGDVTFTGRGVSTDVIKASIKAYLGAINKWKKVSSTK